MLYDIVTMGPVLLCLGANKYDVWYMIWIIWYSDNGANFCLRANNRGLWQKPPTLLPWVQFSQVRCRPQQIFSTLFIFWENTQAFLGVKTIHSTLQLQLNKRLQVRVETLHFVRIQHYCSALWQISRIVVWRNSPDIKWGAGLRETQSKLCVNGHKIQFKTETRLTFNCAHLRSRKESLTFEYLDISFYRKIHHM